MAIVTHKGGCHCGRVRFEVTALAALTVLDCNCSICHKSAYLHLMVSKSQFSLICGEDVLSTYTWNTGAAKHLFCSVCGIQSFYVSQPDGYSINARCFDDGTVEKLIIVPHDGRD